LLGFFDWPTASQRHEKSALSVKDFRAPCDYISVPEKRTSEINKSNKPKP